MTTPLQLSTDLAIIGTGIGGMAAAVFASNRGLSVVQAGSTGALAYTSGVFDVLGAIPNQKSVSNPFADLPALLAEVPGHPYSHLSEETIRAAFVELGAFLNDTGIRYIDGDDANFHVLTPAGTIKHSWSVPETIINGCRAFEEKLPCLIVDLKGLKGFSARQIAANLAGQWPGIRAATVRVPGYPASEVFPESVARMLETPDTRKAFAEEIRPHLNDAKIVGLPAILGMHRPGDVAREMEKLLGVEIFEIPTMPPGVPGIRLKETFEDKLPERGVTLLCQQKISGTFPEAQNTFELDVTGQPTEYRVRADAVLLASGRFLGGGLNGEREGIEETVFNLPVTQPGSRSHWHETDYFCSGGHAVNRAGLEVDNQFRPLGADGAPAHQNLYAAGSILAHQDWIRMKCGAGVAIATAYAAVRAIADSRAS